MVSSSVSWDDGSGGRLISGTTTAKDYIGEPHTVGSSSKKSPALFFDIKGSWYSTPVEYEGGAIWREDIWDFHVFSY